MRITFRKYDGSSDRTQIDAMTERSELRRELFDRHERRGDEYVTLACDGERVVGYVTVGGRYRRTDTSCYVVPEYRGRGVGTSLMKIADDFFVGNNWTELSTVTRDESESDSLCFMQNCGYVKFCDEYVMTLDARRTDAPYTFRGYTDDDYSAYHDVDDAFFIMRHRVGLLPDFYAPMNDDDRQSKNADRDNRFVLVDGGEICAISAIGGGELAILAVRPDKQGRGYGRAMAAHTVNELINRGHDTVSLCCVVGNGAFYFYRKLGFREVDIRHVYTKYYRPDRRPRLPAGFRSPEEFIRFAERR